MVNLPCRIRSWRRLPSTASSKSTVIEDRSRGPSCARAPKLVQRVAQTRGKKPGDIDERGSPGSWLSGLFHRLRQITNISASCTWCSARFRFAIRGDPDRRSTPRKSRRLRPCCGIIGKVRIEDQVDRRTVNAGRPRRPDRSAPRLPRSAGAAVQRRKRMDVSPWLRSCSTAFLHRRSDCNAALALLKSVRPV